jgi:hypothetical protein
MPRLPRGATPAHDDPGNFFALTNRRFPASATNKRSLSDQVNHSTRIRGRAKMPEFQWGWAQKKSLIKRIGALVSFKSHHRRNVLFP